MKKQKKRAAPVKNERAPKGAKSPGDSREWPRVLDGDRAVLDSLSERPRRARCYYCGDPVIAARLERDHFPVPECAGGTQTVDACQQCHDLKDRTSWKDVPAEMKAEFMEEFQGMGRASKIIFAQLLRAVYEWDVRMRPKF